MEGGSTTTTTQRQAERAGGTNDDDDDDDDNPTTPAWELGGGGASRPQRQLVEARSQLWKPPAGRRQRKQELRLYPVRWATHTQDSVGERTASRLGTAVAALPRNQQLNGLHLTHLARGRRTSAQVRVGSSCRVGVRMVTPTTHHQNLLPAGPPLHDIPPTRR